MAGTGNSSFRLTAALIFLIVYLLIAISFSIFYGFKGAEIFLGDKTSLSRKKRRSAWEFHQFWLHFVSALLGWATLFYLIVIRFKFLLTIAKTKLTLSDFVLGIIAFLGITSLLPYVILRLTSLKDR